MKIVEFSDGALELRWTWLPYWMAVSPMLKLEVEDTIKDALVLNQIPADDAGLERINTFVINLLAKKFKIPGLAEFLTALSNVQDPKEYRKTA